MVEEVVEVDTQTIVQPVGLEAKVQTIGLLESDLVITDIVELSCRHVSQILQHSERRAGSIVTDIVITRDVVAGLEEEVVQCISLREPSLIGNSPTELQAGEDTPLHTCELQSA